MVRALMAVTLLLFVNTSVAEVFKCEARDGKVSYQESDCAKSSLQKKLEIQKIDPEITRKAIETLNKDIQAFKAEQEKRKALEVAQEKEQERSNSAEIYIENFNQNNRDRNYFSRYPGYYKKRKSRLTRRNSRKAGRNQRNSFNPPTIPSRKSSMNPPIRR